MNDDARDNDIKLPSPLSVYNRAIQLMGMDSVHDAIAQGGMDVLRHGIPYLIVAARWQKFRTYRKRSGQELPTNNTEGVIAPMDIWNPYLQLERNETLRIVTEALAEFPDHDIIVIWDRLEGYTDEEIRQKLVKLKIGPSNPTLPLIRKRRERALKRLRTILKKRLSHEKSLKK